MTWASHTKRWRAAYAGKHLGYFETSWDAALAFNTASRAAYGDSAYQNAWHPEPLTDPVQPTQCVCGDDLPPRPSGTPGRPPKYCSTCRIARTIAGAARKDELWASADR